MRKEINLRSKEIEPDHAGTYLVVVKRYDTGSKVIDWDLLSFMPEIGWVKNGLPQDVIAWTELPWACMVAQYMQMEEIGDILDRPRRQLACALKNFCEEK